MAVLGQDRFGMELHPLNRQRFVAHAHDFAVVGPGADAQAGAGAQQQTGNDAKGDDTIQDADFEEVK